MSEGEKGLKYWLERGGQIKWRLGEAKKDVAQMERDLRECDLNIAKLKGGDNGR